jgi:hypothetical protein
MLFLLTLVSLRRRLIFQLRSVSFITFPHHFLSIIPSNIMLVARDFKASLPIENFPSANLTLNPLFFYSVFFAYPRCHPMIHIYSKHFMNLIPVWKMTVTFPAPHLLG